MFKIAQNISQRNINEFNKKKFFLFFIFLVKSKILILNNIALKNDRNIAI